jgi:hypothetical protein
LHHLQSFAGDIGSTVDGWQRYGIHLGGEEDDDMGDFAFYPKLFLQPLRKKIEAQLQFQEMMAVSLHILLSIIHHLPYLFDHLTILSLTYLILAITAFTAIHRICIIKTANLDITPRYGPWRSWTIQ